MSITSELTQAVKEDFLDRNRDLLALTTNGPNDVFKRISASLALNTEAQDNVMFYADPEVLGQKGYAGQVARDSFKHEMYREICVAFIRIQHNLVVTWAAKLTAEAQTQLEDIEIAAGQRPPRAVVPPPPPPPTAAEQLEAEVRHDWVHLRTSEVKRKCYNVAYRAMFDKLMNAGQLESVCTSLHDGGREFHPAAPGPRWPSIAKGVVFWAKKHNSAKTRSPPLKI